MRLRDDTLTLSATDLANFLGCRHRTALELEFAAGLRERPHFDDPLLELLFQRGTDHEKDYVATLAAAGRSVVDLGNIMTREALLAATLDAMRSGADVIVQGALSNGQWFGKPDLLMRVPQPSALGDWSYEVSDTKLARETRAGAVLQLSLYSEMLGLAQGARPANFQVVTPDPDHPIHSFRVDDYAAYFRLVRDQLADMVTRAPANIIAEFYPEPVAHCQICPWSGPCQHVRREDDHLSLVANITRSQRQELVAYGVGTLAELGSMALPLPFKPDRGSAESFTRVREQARLQLESRTTPPPPKFETRDVVPEQGLCRLPEPSPGDLFLDLEGDNMAVEGGREYLFGLVYLDENGAAQYRSWWAFDDHSERAAFEEVMDVIGDAMTQHPDMHVYHYAPYEVTAFKRLMGHYATREDELDAMLRGGRFVDLYAVVHQGIRAGIERYSIKNLEVLYGYTREVPLPDAGRRLKQFEYALALDVIDELPPEVRETVEGYNKDDCVSTLLLRNWLETVRQQVIDNGDVIPRPTVKDAEPPKELDDRQRRKAALRDRLLAGIDDVPPEDTVEHARWLLAHMLDYHRRESKAGWWKYYELLGSTDEQLLDESEAVAGLAFAGRVDLVKNVKTGKPTGSVIDRYAYPPQEMEIRSGATLKNRDESKFADVVTVDRIARTIDVKKGKAQVDRHPTSAFAFKHVGTDGIEDGIASIGDAVVVTDGVDGANGIARALLRREAPRLTSGIFHQDDSVDASALAVNVVLQLDHTVLAIQGPPGSGKTYTGARMIRALVAEGKRVGVLGPSHKVISNLLCAVAEADPTLRIAQKCPDDGDDLPTEIRGVDDNDEALRLLVDREVDVLGGTAWLWSRADFAGAVDVLFVDEAGQVPLANAVAVSAAAESMVLLGDPQQLDQPLKGSHPDGVDASVLAHILGEHLTIPSDRGLFLPVTWRLSPEICAFTSELFYESRLTSNRVQSEHDVTGMDGLWYLDVEHDGRTSSCIEEVHAVVGLVERLTRRVALEDILVVSPFNAQVSRLAEALPGGARVGTVDKFQGQEAPVVIYSMVTSRPEDAPRGMEFLYSLNRLNVATSRAKHAVVIVANRRLFEPECRTPRQMKLANAVCRYRELARPMIG
ncbi:MAG: TM0106 family RecB-like putative nuclease [Gemmatimonadaceae bacterium]